MTIETFASKYKLRTKKDGEEVIVPGKLGHLFMNNEDEDEIGALYMPDEPSKGWKARRETFLKAGATLKQNGDTEGSVTFLASDKNLVKIAIKVLGIYRKRTVTPEITAKRVEALKKARGMKKR
jgi:hypothetical protein